MLKNKQTLKTIAKLKKNGDSIRTEVDFSGINILTECSKICKTTSKVCMGNGLKVAALKCIECAEVCHLALKFITCRSEFVPKILKLCLAICKRCEEECLKTENDLYANCANVCGECIDFISNIAKK